MTDELDDIFMDAYPVECLGDEVQCPGDAEVAC
jgi:hypothetical protein